jgi:predicted RNase H-like HicB family nuclease
MRFTAIIERDAEGVFVGQIEEVPAAISQGATLEELKENLQDALELILKPITRVKYFSGKRSPFPDEKAGINKTPGKGRLYFIKRR